MDEFKRHGAIGWGRKERKWFNGPKAKAEIKAQDRNEISSYNDPCYYCTGGQHCGSCKCCTYSDTR